MIDKEIVQWLVNNCLTVQRKINGQYVMRWAIKEDAVNAWEGEFDSKLPLYTSEEIIEIYKDTL